VEDISVERLNTLKVDGSGDDILGESGNGS